MSRGAMGRHVVATAAGADERFASARAVADATMFEGYVLYPYRASARKNQVRWQFGVLTPRGFADSDGSERWSLRTECVVDPGTAPSLTVRVRFLQLQHRTVEAAVPGGYATADTLEVDGRRWVPWDEGAPRTVDVPPLRLLPIEGACCDQAFAFRAGEEREVVTGDDRPVGRIVRRREAVEGRVRVVAAWADGPGALVKVTVTVENTSPWMSAGARRDDALPRSLVAVHVMLAVDDGEFVSAIDPPDDARTAVDGCANDGTFPVLIARDVMLSSPIILYDFPLVAPESPGDMYDATEIDEILALRVLTLTDDEKAEARGTDSRAAAIVDRCDDMPPEVWERLHGAVRPLSPSATAPAVPWWDPGADASVDPESDIVSIAGVEVGAGTPVRLRPSRRADAHDLFLAGLTATVAGVFHDVDGAVHVAVTVDGDPATEELAWQGRYLYFHPDEVEPVDVAGDADDAGAGP